jgi:hypothetical protein
MEYALVSVTFADVAGAGPPSMIFSYAVLT